MGVRLPTTDEPVVLIQGDCLDVLRQLPDGCVDAVVTDPPWMEYETAWYDASDWHRPVAKVEPRRYAKDLARVCRIGGAVLLWCRWDAFDEHASALRAVSIQVRNCVVWGKPNHTAGDLNGNLGNQHECAVFGSRGVWFRHDSRETNLFSRGFRHHPTEKPLGLMRRSVNLASPPGRIVLDPFMGSGTTGVACVQTGRKFIGIEIDPGYFSIAQRRINEALGVGGLFESKPAATELFAGEQA
jgi:site-specific DNA-methyltransferase (adenine-specific)